MRKHTNTTDGASIRRWRALAHRFLVFVHILLDLLHLVVRLGAESLDSVTGAARVLQ